MITVGKKLIPPSVAGSLFGPFASKRLPHFIKAEGPESPKEPQQPPPEPPQTPPTGENETPPEQLQEQGGGAESPPNPPEDPNRSNFQWVDREGNTTEPTPPPEGQEQYPVWLDMPNGQRHFVWVDGNGRVVRVEGETIPIEEAQTEVERIEGENQIEDDYPPEEPDEPEPEPPFQVPPEPPNTIKFSKMDHEFLKDMKSMYFDDAPRLIFADWMEEKGGQENADFAEWVRLSVERIRRINSNEYNYELDNRMSDRMLELMSRYEWDWPWIDTRGGDQIAEPNRGMLRLDVTPRIINDVLRSVPVERAFQLVDSVRLNVGIGRDPHQDLLDLFYDRDFSSGKAERHWLEYVSHLSLMHGDLNEVPRIANLIALHGGGLRDLDLGRTNIGIYSSEGMIRVLANSLDLDNLVRLDLRENNLSEESVENLIISTGLQNIQRLDLRGNGIGRYTGTSDTVDSLRERFGDAVIL